MLESNPILKFFRQLTQTNNGSLTVNHHSLLGVAYIEINDYDSDQSN